MCFLVGVFPSEGVGESAAEQCGHFLSLFVGEAGVVAVGFRVFDIDFLVRHVEVAAYNDGLFLA